MKHGIIEERLETPLAGSFDVCVIGGSCTGVFAAARAAQAGASVALIEANGFFGGVATAGLVNIWHSFYDTEGKEQIIAGLTEEMVERLKRRDAARINGKGNPDAYAVLNVAELCIELDMLVAESKSIRPFLHTRFVRPVMDGSGHVTHAVIEDKSGRRAIAAKCFVDASGDGDLVHRSGLPTWKAAVLQPPTTGFALSGSEIYLKEHPDFNLESVLAPENGGGFKHSFMWWSEYVGVKDMRFIAASRMNGADCSDAEGLTAAELEGRRQIRAFCDVLRGPLDGAGAFTLAALPACIGIRETRHACCLHKLSESDVLEGLRFDDAIANGSYRVDIHHGGGITFKHLDGRSFEMCAKEGAAPKWIWGRWRPEQDSNPVFYQIPYRSLVPKGSKNVLCAGRLVDADSGAYGAVRVMVNCNQTGEAAGLAAAMSAGGACEVAGVDVQELRRRLSAAGALII